MGARTAVERKDGGDRVTRGERADARAPIAVLIPVYNASEALHRTIGSIDVQSCAFDVIVVDDGSEPPILVRPEDYRHPIHVIRMPRNGGIEHALNEGLRHVISAGYDFVARQDAGDSDVEERLERQQSYLREHPEVALVGAWTEVVDPEGTGIFVFAPPTDASAIRRRMRYSPAFIHPSTMMRVSALAAIGGYRSYCPFAEDYDLFFRLCSKFGCANIGEVLVRKEENPTSLSVGKRRRSLRSRIKVQLTYFDWLSPHSYFGLVYSTLLYAIPYPLLIRLKRIRGAVT